MKHAKLQTTQILIWFPIWAQVVDSRLQEQYHNCTNAGPLNSRHRNGQSIYNKLIADTLMRVGHGGWPSWGGGESFQTVGL